MAGDVQRRNYSQIWGHKFRGHAILSALLGAHRNWWATLKRGLEAGDLSTDHIPRIETHERTGRPLGDDSFVERLETLTGRVLKRQKPERKK